MRFLQVYKDLKTKGELSSPRGQKVLEIQDYMITIPARERFTSYRARKFNLDYAKLEMLWYLTGDPRNEMILKCASIWPDVRQPDGQWYSNYGRYWFGHQQGFYWVVGQLMRDKDSRQAVIPMLNHLHCFIGNVDVVCTYSISFRIRNDKLYMSVNMRSQDAIWGFTNDTFCFSVLHELVYVYLRDSDYPDLQMGTFTHKVDSFHVYEKHFDMLESILEDGKGGYYEVQCPHIFDKHEVMGLIDFGYKAKDDSKFEFTRWLNDNKYTDGNR
jgi:thymidylate synthase